MKDSHNLFDYELIEDEERMTHTDTVFKTAGHITVKELPSGKLETRFRQIKDNFASAANGENNLCRFVKSGNNCWAFHEDYFEPL